MTDNEMLDGAQMPLLPAFSIAGGKKRIASLVWQRFGNPLHYIEPFAGSAAVLLGRPTTPRDEILNDINGHVANFWNAAKYHCEELARHCHFPPSQAALTARHQWLIGQDFTSMLKADPNWCDPKAAAWWAWGHSLFIGSNFCVRGESGTVPDKRPHLHRRRGVHRQQVLDQRPSLLDNQKDAHRKGTRRFTCVQDYLDDLVFRIENNLPSQWEEDLQFYFRALQRRLERVALLHGDWRSCITPSILFARRGETGIFFDPPYDPKMCASEDFYGDVGNVAEEIRAWCKAYGDNPRLKIALCGLEDEHTMPSSWECVAWRNQGGAKGRKDKERIWFSPHCTRP